MLQPVRTVAFNTKCCMIREVSLSDMHWRGHASCDAETGPRRGLTRGQGKGACRLHGVQILRPESWKHEA